MRVEPAAAEGVPTRSRHDPLRPVLSTGQAAKRLGQSRFHIARQVESGALPGYGIPGTERTRWYVYEDAVARIEAGPAALRAVPGLTSQADLADHLAQAETALHSIRRELNASRDHGTRAVNVAIGALDEWSEVADDPQISLKRHELLEQTNARDTCFVQVEQGLLNVEEALRTVRLAVVEMLDGTT